MTQKYKSEIIKNILDDRGHKKPSIHYQSECIEGTMHLNTSGESIKPLFSGEVPVEATTQNLNSFTDVEEE